jgi:hypothetical protein
MEVIFIKKIAKKLMEDVFRINEKAKMKPKGSIMVLYSKRSGNKVNQKMEIVKKMLEECNAKITKVVEHWQKLTIVEFEYDLETFEKKLKKIYENKKILDMFENFPGTKFLLVCSEYKDGAFTGNNIWYDFEINSKKVLDK